MPLSDELLKVRRGGIAPVPPPDVRGLIFPSNSTTGSDIRLIWDGANLLSRTSHTAIWKIKYNAQAGFYAVAWHSPNTGSWDSGGYSWGTHPYPTDGNIDANGFTSGTGSSGTVHYAENAGIVGPFDQIASASSPGPQTTFLVTKGIWYTQARTVENISGTLVHTFYPDIENDRAHFIRQNLAASSLGSAGSTPAFYFGGSDWRSNAGGSGLNDETLSGTIRQMMLYSVALTAEQIAGKAILLYDDTTDPNVWYSCVNPTPTDITDKSGAGHTPTWANANRPTLYTG